jgi:hypothetical protein
MFSNTDRLTQKYNLASQIGQSVRGRLKKLYQEVSDRNSNAQLQLRNSYAGTILSGDDPDPHADGWLLGDVHAAIANVRGMIF